jgi:hypothetical protein
MEKELRILHLSLTQLPFDLMAAEYKNFEYRKPSDWLKSRLYHANGSLKEYDVIKFTNGYGHKRPFFVCEYLSFFLAERDFKAQFKSPKGMSLEISVKEGDIIIALGKILERGNI